MLPSIEIPDKVNWRDYSCKVSYNLKLEWKEKYSTKKVISKILKLDESNQNGYAMTKLLPTGTIQKKVPSLREFNLLRETVNLDNSIGYLFVVEYFF